MFDGCLATDWDACPFIITGKANVYALYYLHAKSLHLTRKLSVMN